MNRVLILGVQVVMFVTGVSMWVYAIVMTIVFFRDRRRDRRLKAMHKRGNQLFVPSPGGRAGLHAVETKEEIIMADRLCDENCNECGMIRSGNYRLLTLILNEAYERFGAQFYAIVQKHCPNLTCCAGCHIDDFCHAEDCEIIRSNPTEKGNGGSTAGDETG